MAEPGRPDPSADFSTNQVFQDFFHWSFFQSPEGQAGVPEACRALEPYDVPCLPPAPRTTEARKAKGRGTTSHRGGDIQPPGLNQGSVPHAVLHLHLF